MSNQLKKLLKKSKILLKNTNGQGLVEYALILVLVAVTAVVAVKALGTTTSQVYTNINGELKK